MIFGFMVDFHKPLNTRSFFRPLKNAGVPSFLIVAASIRGSDQDPTLIYTTRTPQEISYWAHRTLLVQSPSNIDLEQLRADESQKKVSSPDNDLTWAHNIPSEPADHGPASRFKRYLF